ncbi:putative uncharacterized protein [Parachlamydia acanthamoebae UV-7]|uniref:Uncharacterized protein n=1 Tax=Parachlamydia acanthamoebae (strain UV7) TaxID=765952 RepID=F8KUT4_PARAV|nr:hypothetical protein [Parachlamydia acanthamoebae]CCB84999.1 putative uncharacterized protein [Parachlamydia acanthamoebae UV-7]
MTKLNTALNNTSSFTDLYTITKDIKEGVSFFGFRYVSVQGYRGRVHIDKLSLAIQSVIKKNCNYDEINRAQLKEISFKITNLYKSNDKTLKQKNIITRLFCEIRDSCRSIKEQGVGPRFQWEKGIRGRLYDFYTANQYLSSFGVDPTKEKNLVPGLLFGYLTVWHAPSKKKRKSPEEIELKKRIEKFYFSPFDHQKA